MPSDELKLAAIDEEDLAVISAHVQDAILKVGDMVYRPKERRFAIAMNRFGWECADDTRRHYERHRAALVFDRVRSVKSHRIDRTHPDAILELLALRFLPRERGTCPDGTVELLFAGGGTVRVDVECIETRLTDLGLAWPTEAVPHHDLAGERAATARAAD